MAYGELENKILKLALENPINMDAVQKLFDMGADPNAAEDWNEKEQQYDYLLFTDCFFESKVKRTV